MNELIDSGVVRELARILADASSGVPAVAGDGIRFDAVSASADAVDGLNLRARSDVVAHAIVADLRGAVEPGEVERGAVEPGAVERQAHERGAAVFRGALADAAFTGWMLWPVTEAVATLALASPDARAFDDGLSLLAELTPRLTAEFAIRRFLDADLDRALAVISTWTRSPNEHVRRLASEGTRPFLPWATRVPGILTAPQNSIPILAALRSDESASVRRSVANHLNDLNRQHADLLVSTATEWMRDADENARSEETPHAADNTRWVVRHGIRTLIKKGHPGALALMGFGATPVSVSELRLETPNITLPGTLDFVVDVTNESEVAARLVIDYVVHYVKASGSSNEKVFKLAVRTLDRGETVRLRKRHGLRQMTTRVHYPGVHAVELQVNGQRHARAEFTVEL
ncbi:DNA alkylation repair protein [Okibacterium endophyticum]